MPIAAYYPAHVESRNSLRDLSGRGLNLLYPQSALDAPNCHYHYPSGHCVPVAHSTPHPPPPPQFVYPDHPYVYTCPPPPQYASAPVLIPSRSSHFYHQLDNAPLNHCYPHPYPIPAAYPQYVVPELVSAPGWHFQDPHLLTSSKHRSENTLEDVDEGQDAKNCSYEMSPPMVVPKNADAIKRPHHSQQFMGFPLPVMWKEGVPYGLIPLARTAYGQKGDLRELATACIQPAEEHKLGGQAGIAASDLASSAQFFPQTKSSLGTSFKDEQTTSAQHNPACVVSAMKAQSHGAEQHAKKDKDMLTENEIKSMPAKKNKENEAAKVSPEHRPMHIAWCGGVPCIVLPPVEEQGKESVSDVAKQKPSKKKELHASSKVNVPAVQDHKPKKVASVVHVGDPKRLHPSNPTQVTSSDPKHLTVTSASSVADVVSSDDRALSMPAQVLTDQHLTTEDQLQPSSKKHSPLTPESAALHIQAAYRGHMVRTAQPLKHLKIIKDVQACALEIFKQMEDDAIALKNPDKHRRISESILALLLKLDSVQGALPFVRDCRKMVAKALSRAVENLDAIFQEARPASEGETRVMNADQMACVSSKTTENGKQGEEKIEGEIKWVHGHQLACLPSETIDYGREGEEEALGYLKDSKPMDEVHDTMKLEKLMRHDSSAEQTQVDVEVKGTIMEDKMPHDDNMVGNDTLHDKRGNLTLGEVANEAWRGVCQDRSISNANSEDTVQVKIEDSMMEYDSCAPPCQDSSASDSALEDTIQLKVEDNLATHEMNQSSYQIEECPDPAFNRLAMEMLDKRTQGKMGNLYNAEVDDAVQAKMENCMPEVELSAEAFEVEQQNEGHESMKVPDHKMVEKMEISLCEEIAETKSVPIVDGMEISPSDRVLVVLKEDVGSAEHKAGVACPNDRKQIETLDSDDAESETLEQVRQGFEAREDVATSNIRNANKDITFREDIVIEGAMENLPLGNDLMAGIKTGNMGSTAACSDLDLDPAIASSNIVQDGNLCDQNTAKENVLNASSQKNVVFSWTAENQGLLAIVEKLRQWNEQQAAIIQRLSERMQRLEQMQGKERASGTLKRIGRARRKTRGVRTRGSICGK